MASAMSVCPIARRMIIFTITITVNPMETSIAGRRYIRFTESKQVPPTPVCGADGTRENL